MGILGAPELGVRMRVLPNQNMTQSYQLITLLTIPHIYGNGNDHMDVHNYFGKFCIRYPGTSRSEPLPATWEIA